MNNLKIAAELLRIAKIVVKEDFQASILRVGKRLIGKTFKCNRYKFNSGDSLWKVLSITPKGRLNAVWVGGEEARSSVNSLIFTPSKEKGWNSGGLLEPYWYNKDAGILSPEDEYKGGPLQPKTPWDD